MKISPAVHYSMGGLWVDYERDDNTGGLVLGSPRNHHSNVPGIFVLGEADYQYHGANRLGANSLLSCIFAGMIVAPSAKSYLAGVRKRSADLPPSLFESACAAHRQAYQALINRNGDENPYTLHQELGDTMT